MQLLRTILIIIIAYYLFRLIARYVLPWITRYLIRKSMDDRNGGHTKGKKEGEVNVNYSQKKKSLLDDVGEYVDYEEINDDKTRKK